jgi:hypothetical protein
VSLGVQAVGRGSSAAFFRLEELPHATRQDAAPPPARLEGKESTKAALAIIDEVGFEAFPRGEANPFIRPVSRRDQRGSLCITSNQAIKDWPEVPAGDAGITAATPDRLPHPGHVLNIRGRSSRLRGLEEDLKGRSWRPATVPSPGGARTGGDRRDVAAVGGPTTAAGNREVMGLSGWGPSCLGPGGNRRPGWEGDGTD